MALQVAVSEESFKCKKMPKMPKSSWIWLLQTNLVTFGELAQKFFGYRFKDTQQAINSDRKQV